MESSNNLPLTSDAKYEAWRENLSSLYDIFVKDKLASPSLTVQWLPSPEKRRGQTPKRVGNLRLKQRLVLGSSNTDEDNHLKIATILFSEKRLKTHIDRMLSKPNPATCFIKMGTKIIHSGIVNRARYMPQNPAILATKSSNGDVYIYDVRKIFPASRGNETCDPELKLKGLAAGGSGMSWNPNRKGYILSSSINERTILLWDINSKSVKYGNSLNNFSRCHPSGVKDCSWHSLHSSLFGSAGNDKKIHIWDIRANFTKMPAITGVGHKSSVNCLSFSYFSDHLLATGSSDQTIAIWDLRKMKSPCHRISWYKAEICQLHWSPNNESILASSGVGDRVLVWDISEIGAHQTPEEAKEAPPELLFVHGGHTDNILDFSWNLTEPWLLSSVSQDNVIQVWQMGSHIYDKSIDKKSPRSKSCKSKESSECLAIPSSSDTISGMMEPGNSNDSQKAQQLIMPTCGFAETIDRLVVPGPSKSFSSQAFFDSSSFGSSVISGPIEPANLKEARNSPKSQKSMTATFDSGEATENIDTSEPSKTLDLTPDYLFSSPLNSPLPLIDELDMLLKPLPRLSPLSESSFEFFSSADTSPELPQLPTSKELPKTYVSRLSPLSKSSLEDSSESAASPDLPKFPTSMESPKSLELPSTPESLKSLELTSSKSPTPPDTAKVILLPYLKNSELYPELPKEAEVTNIEEEQDKQLDAEGTSHFPVSNVSTLFSLPDSQPSLPTTHEYSTSFSHSSGKDPMISVLPSELLWHICEGFNYTPFCRVCYFLHKDSKKKGDESSSEDYQSPQISFSTPHHSSQASSLLESPTLSETQKQANTFQSADTNITDILIFSDDPVLTDFKSKDGSSTQDFQELADDSLTSDTQGHPENPLKPYDTATQDSQMLSSAYVPANILDHSDGVGTKDFKLVQEITHNPKKPILSNFQTPPVSPATQVIKTPQDALIYSEDTPNIQESQGENVSTIDNSNNLPFQNITECPYVNIPSSQDRPQHQEVPAASEVNAYPNLQNLPEDLELADVLNLPDVSSIQDTSITPEKPIS